MVRKNIFISQFNPYCLWECKSKIIPLLRILSCIFGTRYFIYLSNYLYICSYEIVKNEYILKFSRKVDKITKKKKLKKTLNKSKKLNPVSPSGSESFQFSLSKFNFLNHFIGVTLYLGYVFYF